jgi:hypothetical protein
MGLLYNLTTVKMKGPNKSIENEKLSSVNYGKKLVNDNIGLSKSCKQDQGAHSMFLVGIKPGHLRVASKCATRYTVPYPQYQIN